MMRSTFFWLLSFGGFAAVSLLCGLLVWPQLVAVWPCVQDKLDQFRRLPPLAKVMLSLFVGAFVVYGSTKTNGVDHASGTNFVEIADGCTNGVEIVGGETNDVEGIEGNANEMVSCGGAGRAALPSAMPPPVNGLAFSAPRIATLCDEWPSSVDDDDIRSWDGFSDCAFKLRHLMLENAREKGCQAMAMPAAGSKLCAAEHLC